MVEKQNVPSVELAENERIEPLDERHSIIQSTDGYRFGSDAVALARFACSGIKSSDKVFDLCSGCGIIGILIAIENDCIVDGAELDESLFDMSVRSCSLNGLENVSFVNADIRIADALGGKATYDVAVCNPPFYKADSIARKTAPTANSELTVTLCDVVRAAKHLLKVGGALYLVHTASRLDEVLCECRGNGLVPKELVINPNGKTFMLRAVRGGKDGLTVNVEDF